jgi:hypothetical protein
MPMLDFVRRLEDLTKLKAGIKCRSARNFFTYLLLPILMHVEADINATNLMHGGKPLPSASVQPEGTFLLTQVRRLFHAFRLISGNSVTPVALEKRTEAQGLLEEVLEDCTGRYGDHWAKYTAHNLVHLTEDMAKFSCHLDVNSAYAYENYHQKYNKIMKAGAKPEAQLL